VKAIPSSDDRKCRRMNLLFKQLLISKSFSSWMENNEQYLIKLIDKKQIETVMVFCGGFVFVLFCYVMCLLFHQFSNFPTPPSLGIPHSLTSRFVRSYTPDCGSRIILLYFLKAVTLLHTFLIA